MTWPVRGSSSRPAFTSVFEAGASAASHLATKRRTARTKKIRIRPGDLRCGKNRLRTGSSFITECNHRIDFHGTARGEITRKQCDTEEKESDTCKGQRVGRSHAVEQTYHQVRNDQGADKSNCGTHNGEAQS